MTLDGGHRWLVGKPSLVAFITGHLRAPAEVVKSSREWRKSGLRYVTKPRLAHFAIELGDIKWSSEMARWKATSKGFPTSQL